jgi:hypothetical protein
MGYAPQDEGRWRMPRPITDRSDVAACFEAPPCGPATSAWPARRLFGKAATDSAALAAARTDVSRHAPSPPMRWYRDRGAGYCSA